jgi:hypothetical protein
MLKNLILLVLTGTLA